MIVTVHGPITAPVKHVKLKVKQHKYRHWALDVGRVLVKVRSIRCSGVWVHYEKYW